MPYIKHLSDPSSKDSAAQETLERATIVKAGALTQPHEWLQSRIEESRVEKSARSGTDSGSKRRVLLLGSGLVAGPAVEVFSARSDVYLVIGQSALGHI
jgi:alpha-aminoadipic semialdehyde synthase